jgi:subtilase family serine protease
MPGMLQALRARTRRRAVSSAAIAAIAASAGLAGAASLAAGPAAAAPASTARVGSLVLLPQGVRALGALSSSTEISVDVVLQPRDPAALTAFANAVSTPGSPLFRDYLPKGAFAGRFGPTAAAISAVEASLRSEGLRPGAITSNHLIIPVTATAGQFAKAFSTSFERYNVGGRIAYANTRAPLFSASIARYLIGVVGLDNIYQAQHQSLLAPVHAAAESAPVRLGKDASGPQACSQAALTADVYGAYTANELATAYGFTSLYSAGDLGAGQTIALFELEKNKPSDIAAYQTCYGTSAKVTYIKVDGGAKGSAAGEGEAALDIEDLIGLAPKANIEVYQGPNSNTNNTGLLDVYNKIVSDDTAKVMSSSWGECESEAGATLMNTENKLFEQAATQGQSLFAAAGDGGSTDCETNSGTIENKVEADDPASQPYVTGVGGTKLPKSGAEVVWNESSLSEGAGGGGVSAQWKMPSYQSGAPKSLNVINRNSSGTQCKATSGDCREEPDVSANADPSTGYMIYYTGTAAGETGWLPIGGTSAASPLWAALMALVNADSACKAPIGFANAALYKVAATSYKTTFTDITSGDNDYTPSGYTGGLYPAGTAYDMASGLGSPKAGPLAAALCALGGSGGGGKIKVTNPGTQRTAVGAKVSLPIKATDSTSGATLSYTATGLPAGLKIAATTGLITGKPTKKATDSVTVTVKDNKGVTSDVKFTWDIT